MISSISFDDIDTENEKEDEQMTIAVTDHDHDDGVDRWASRGQFTLLVAPQWLNPTIHSHLLDELDACRNE